MLVEGLVSVITLAALCGAAVVPVEESDIQLTASDADSGNWTANMGEMEINIEHEHNGGSNANGTWTLTMARTFYDKEEEGVEQNNSQEKTNESLQSMETTSTSTLEIEDNKLPEEEEDEHRPIDIVPEEMSNSIPMEETLTKEAENKPDSYSPHYPSFVPPELYPFPDLFKMLPPPPPPPQQMGIVPPYFRGYAPLAEERRYAPYAEDHFSQNLDLNSDSQEIVLDPDNFEYFKGVGWFKLDSRAMSWENAQDACLAVGAHLAVPDTQRRINVFLKLFQRHPEIPRGAILRSQVYVGVYDPLKNRVFTTVQGYEFNPVFPIWFTNEPDNAPPGEDCVTFHMEGKIRDVPCHFQLPFFCEKDLPVVI